MAEFGSSQRLCGVSFDEQIQRFLPRSPLFSLSRSVQACGIGVDSVPPIQTAKTPRLIVTKEVTVGNGEGYA
jgi:hypothetical protein